MRFLFIIALLVLVSGCSKKEVRTEIPEAEQPEAFLKYGDQFYQNGDYDNAFRAYGYIYENYPTSREYIDAAIGLSRCYGALQDYDKGFDILYDLLQNNLIPTKVPQIYNAIGEFYERSAGISEQLSGAGDSDYRNAIDYYDKSIKYPNSEDLNAKGYAQYRIGVLYEKLDEMPKALEAYELAQNQYLGTEWAGRAEQNISDINKRVQLRNEYELRDLLPEQPDSVAVPTTPSDTTEN